MSDSVKATFIRGLLYTTPFACILLALSFALSVSLPALALDEDFVEPDPITIKLDIDNAPFTGSRTLSSSALATTFPIDFLMHESLADTNHSETGRAIQALAPSFNFPSAALADGSDVVKAATLRGLGPDQVLVLVNDLRRHKSALLHVNQSLGRGTAGTDMNAIPPSFIGGVEILRDGAAALYGSDAIAGVINLKLRETTGGEIISSYGQSIEGDGKDIRAAFNYGIDLPHNGFLFFGYEFQEKDATDRSGLSGTLFYTPPAGTSDAAACNANDNSGCDAREFTANRQNFIIGDPDNLQHSWVINSGINTGPVQWRGFALYTARDNKSYGYFREPDDLGRNSLALYPDGFLPRINSTLEDLSASLSASVNIDGWDLELAGVHGRNDFDFTIANSLNASFGADSPTTVDAGGLAYHEDTVDFNAKGFVLGFDVATGAEWKRENYRIRAGNPYSYADCVLLETADRIALGDDGVCAEPYAVSAIDGNGNVFATTADRIPGIQSFPGFDPAAARDETRESIALYAEVSRVFGPASASAAVRWEEYHGYSNIWSGRLSGRYEVSSAHALRASVSNGFRAPSLHQIHFNSMSTQTDSIGNLVQTRHFTNDSSFVRMLGVPQLEEETSLNYSLGYILTPNDEFSLTLDAYQIDIDDRIVISGVLRTDDLKATEHADILLTLKGAFVSSAQFMLNGPDTRTRGIELVAQWTPDMGDYSAWWQSHSGTIGFKLAGHYAKTDVASSFNPPGLLAGLQPKDIIGAATKSQLEDWQPAHRIALTTDYTIGAWTISNVINHYGAYEITNEGTLTSPAAKSQKFDAAFVVDVRVKWQPRDGMSLTLYGHNIFDQYPESSRVDKDRAGAIAGIVDSPLGVQRYSPRTAPYGFNGAFWGLQFKYNF